LFNHQATSISLCLSYLNFHFKKKKKKKKKNHTQHKQKQMKYKENKKKKELKNVWGIIELSYFVTFCWTSPQSWNMKIIKEISSQFNYYFTIKRRWTNRIMKSSASASYFGTPLCLLFLIVLTNSIWWEGVFGNPLKCSVFGRVSVTDKWAEL